MKRPKDESEPLAQRLMRGMLRPKRFLIVDDDEILVEYIRIRAAEKFSADIVIAHTLAQAREFLNAEPPVDVAFLDVRLTGESGLTLYQEIVEKMPWIVVIFITGYDHQALREKIELIGPAQVYSKDRIVDPEFFDRLFLNIGFRYKVGNGDKISD